jgi:hypothetical protein
LTFDVQGVFGDPRRGCGEEANGFGPSRGQQESGELRYHHLEPLVWRNILLIPLDIWKKLPVVDSTVEIFRAYF